MLPKLQYNLTNWIDGMKINRQHFVDSENAILDILRDINASMLHSFNYGLLEPLQGEKSALDCNVLYSQPNQFKVIVTHCRAITAGGCRIEILPGIHPELTSDNEIFSNVEKSRGGSGYLAVITVDPFNRRPFGHADASEYPVRSQSSVSSYKLSLVEENSIDTGSLGAFHLPVARFYLNNGDLARDSDYIPPCAVISAHQGTKQIYNTITEYLNQIQEYSKEIVQKIVELSQDVSLATNLKRICEQSILHISSELFRFRTMYRQQSPVHIADCVITLADYVNTCISFMSFKEKEELLQYFSYWNDISPGKFEELLTTVIDADYNHENLNNFFQPILAFLKVWADLLEKMKDLKLIGQKNEKFNFGGRTMESPKEKKGRWSPIE